jgi:hypothetical protein
MSPIQIGLSGISRGLENMQEIASDIAQTGTVQPENLDTTIDLTQSMVDLKAQELATLAATKVIATADEVLGTLIDVRV